MKTISKRIFVFLLVGFFSFCSVEMTYYKSVHAFEWIEAGISTAEAIKWLLGALGIIATAGAASENFWNGYEDDFYEVASQDNIPGPDVRAWLEKLAKGTLDKGSEVWDCFKSWASSLVSNNTGSGSSSSVADLNYILSVVNSELGTNISLGSGWADKTVYAVGVSKYYTNDPHFKIFYNDSSYSWNLVNGDGIYYFDNTVLASDFTVGNTLDYTSNFTTYRSSPWNTGYTPNENSMHILLFGITDNSIGFSHSQSFPITGNISSSGTLQSINDARQEQFDLINRITGNEVEDEVAIPMPGVSAGDDTISQDAYDEIIDRVNNGEITIDGAVEQIQELMKVIVYDDATGDVIPVVPDPEDSSKNQNKDDVLKETKDNMGFTLGGLENVFPFCIPWDIYAFLNILNADPVAPVFNIPFPNVEDPEHPLSTQVDLSSWDNAMRIVRLAEDFLFIIGLAFLTRSMIGAGGGD